jgi:hypothetical protein
MVRKGAKAGLMMEMLEVFGIGLGLSLLLLGGLVVLLVLLASWWLLKDEDW